MQILLRFFFFVAFMIQWSIMQYFGYWIHQLFM
jgi:hypothetical protein